MSMADFIRKTLMFATILAAVSECQAQTMKAVGSPHKVVIVGLVRDVACPMQNHESTSTNFNMDCALACVRAGSPLIILTKEGNMYFPISDQMPDPSQREKLMPFIGKQVRVTGTVYRRNGTRAVVIAEIKELKGIKVRNEQE